MNSKQFTYKQKLKVLDFLLMPYLSKDSQDLSILKVQKNILGSRFRLASHLTASSNDSTLSYQLGEIHKVVSDANFHFNIDDSWQRKALSIWENLVKVVNDDFIGYHLFDEIYPEHLVFILAEEIIPLSDRIQTKLDDCSDKQKSEFLDKLLSPPFEGAELNASGLDDKIVDLTLKLYERNVLCYYLSIAICIVFLYKLHKPGQPLSQFLANCVERDVINFIDPSLSGDADLAEMQLNDYTNAYANLNQKEDLELNWNTYCFLAVLLASNDVKFIEKLYKYYGKDSRRY